MTRTNSENLYPVEGLGWKPPKPVRCETRTARLLIRNYAMDDAPEVFHVVTRTQPSLLPWMPWAKDYKDFADPSHYISQQVIAARDITGPRALGVAITDAASGVFLGSTGVHDIRPDTASGEIGYWIDEARRREGLATEAAAGVISWAFRPQHHSEGGLGLRRIRVYCSSRNDASRRVCEHLGLRQEVHQREDYYVEGVGLTDRMGWGVLADEWDTDRHAMRAG